MRFSQLQSIQSKRNNRITVVIIRYAITVKVILSKYDITGWQQSGIAPEQAA